MISVYYNGQVLVNAVVKQFILSIINTSLIYISYYILSSLINLTFATGYLWCQFIGSIPLSLSLLHYRSNIRRVGGDYKGLNKYILICFVASCTITGIGLTEIGFTRLAPAVNYPSGDTQTYYAPKDANRNTLNKTVIPAVNSVESPAEFLNISNADTLMECVTQNLGGVATCIVPNLLGVDNFTFVGLSNFSPIQPGLYIQFHGMVSTIVQENYEGFPYYRTGARKQLSDTTATVQRLPNINGFGVNVSSIGSLYKGSSYSDKLLRYDTLIHSISSDGNISGILTSYFNTSYSAQSGVTNTTLLSNSSTSTSETIKYQEALEKHYNACLQGNTTNSSYYASFHTSENCGQAKQLLSSSKETLTYMEGIYLGNYSIALSLEKNAVGSIIMNYDVIGQDGYKNIYRLLLQVEYFRAQVTGNIKNNNSTANVEMYSTAPINETLISYNDIAINYDTNNECVVGKCTVNFNSIIMYRIQKLLIVMAITVFLSLVFYCHSRLSTLNDNIIDSWKALHEVCSRDVGCNVPFFKLPGKLLWGEWYNEKTKMNHLGLVLNECEKAQPELLFRSAILESLENKE